jgi:hypothetical protein
MALYVNSIPAFLNVPSSLRMSSNNFGAKQVSSSDRRQPVATSTRVFVFGVGYVGLQFALAMRTFTNPRRRFYTTADSVE